MVWCGVIALVAKNIKVFVQPSNKRIFTDHEYAAVFHYIPPQDFIEPHGYEHIVGGRMNDCIV
jgi:hypothetical protein